VNGGEAGFVAVRSEGPPSVEGDRSLDEQWRRVMAAFDDLTEAYYGEGCVRADATIAEIVMRFFRQCHEMNQRVVSACESGLSSPAALQDFWSNTRALQVCDSLVSAERQDEPPATGLMSKIHRTYTEPNGRAYAIIEYARAGERPRTTDAIVIAENCVNAWARFVRKQRSGGASCASSNHH
jgi:hypothetical protein